MFLFGITGGIGSGKSLVCNFLRQCDIPIMDADRLAKDITVNDEQVRSELIAEFGQNVYLENGQLNKDYMSGLVFSKPDARVKINKIIHPRVLTAITSEARALHENKGHALIGIEAALIYEAGMENIFDAIIVVDAPLDKRIEWVRKRNLLTKAEVSRRINAQTPAIEKRKLADFVLLNDAGLTELKGKSHQLQQWLLHKSGLQK